jgi:O-acetylserine/cysteine efflux transporter
MGASAILLGESLPVWKLAAAGLILSGLAVTVIGPRIWSAKPAA